MKTARASAYTFTVIVIFSCIMLQPKSILAATEKQSGDSTFCDQIDKQADIIQNSQEYLDLTSDTTPEIDSQIQKANSLREASIKWERSSLDKKRQDAISTLSSKLTTESQKTVLSDFQTKINMAVTARRETIDNSFIEYNNDLASLLATKKTAAQNALSDLKIKTNLAISKATSECTDRKIQDSAIQAEFEKNISNAKKTIVSHRKILENLRDGIQKISDTRKTTADGAESTFTKSIGEAFVSFKTMMGIISGQGSSQPVNMPAFQMPTNLPPLPASFAQPPTTPTQTTSSTNN